MKLMWFHLMPYTELPEDFREKNPSVWVDIHSSLFDPRRAPDRRFPGRHADGHLLRLWPEPVDAARALPRSARPRGQGLDRAGDLRLERPLQPAALRQHLAAPGAEAAPADLDSRRRFGR